MGWKKGKVPCPGCGKGMECNEPHLYVGETPDTLKYICGYRCPGYKCGWGAPIGSGGTPKEARFDAKRRAMKRAEPEKEVSTDD